MSGQINFTQVDSPVAPTAGVTALSFPTTATNQLKWVDADGGTNIIAGGGFTLTVPATGTVALTGLTLAQFAATTSAQLAGIISDETGSGALVFATSPIFTTQINTPAIVAPAALTITPAAGSGVNIVLSTTGDFAVNTDDLYVDTSTGNVGIGTTGPTSDLHITSIVNNIGPTLTLELLDPGTSIGINDLVGAIDFQGNDAQGTGVRARILGIGEGTSGETGLAFYTKGAGAGASAEYVRITNAGNVGIGTTGPTNLLSLDGNAARIFWMERHTTANTAGNILTVQAGGATASATDKAGGDLILLPGASTGTGRANVRLRNYSRATATSTADNTAVDRLIVAGAVALTDAATNMFEVALTAGASAGGCILWTIRASDGTDMQAYTGVTTFSAVNKAGVYTKTVTSDVGNDAKAVSAGTLTATFSLLDGTNKVTMQITPTGSLTESSYYQMSYTLFNNSPQAITVL